MIRDIHSRIIDGCWLVWSRTEIASSAQQTGQITSDHHGHQLHTTLTDPTLMFNDVSETSGWISGDFSREDAHIF
ncbi:hypothetical protein QQF64_005191 [Cirrhinus molitorella]|uniref:Uncharacterized protein n=1 Tax=Cirrhinus molitorella TaxID=172907 RepID=A0ABR3MK26_9TELE